MEGKITTKAKLWEKGDCCLEKTENGNDVGEVGGKFSPYLGKKQEPNVVHQAGEPMKARKGSRPGREEAVGKIEGRRCNARGN